MCSMQQLFRDRAHDEGSNDVGPQDNILQTPSARFVASCRRSCSPRRTWCGRRDLNPHGPFKPCGFSYRLRLSPPEREHLCGAHARVAVWTIPSPYPERLGLRCCPSSLYTFPVRGLARDSHLTGFPEFEQFCTPDFPGGTQSWLKSVASTNSATPA